MGTIRKILAKIKELEDEKLEKYLITLEENYQIEFKKSKNSFPEEALKTYSAFANTDGGLLILGVEEVKDGLNISGVNNPEKVKNNMFNLLNNSQKVSKNILTDESIVEKVIADKTVIIIDIPRAHYKDKPIYLKDNPKNAYKRNYEGDYRCTEQEMRIMINDSSTEALDFVLLENFTINDLDPLTINDYFQRFKNLNPEHPFIKLKKEELLKKLGVLRMNRKTSKLELTLGGLLLFGKSEIIRERLNHYHIEYIDRSNPDAERWSDRLIYDGTWEDNLYNFFYLAINKIYTSIPKSFKMMDDNITREQLNEVQIALREVLVNSMIHANFEISKPIKIIKYPNYYQFENPGTLRISQEDFFAGEHSDPRNNIVQQAFRLLNLCERAGSGVPKILKAAKDNKYKYPDIEEKDGKFIFKFWISDRAITNNKTIIESKNLSEIEKRILLDLTKNKYITSKMIQEEYQLSKTTGYRILKKLIDLNFLQKEGNGKNTKYKLF